MFFNPQKCNFLLIKKNGFIRVVEKNSDENIIYFPENHENIINQIKSNPGGISRILKKIIRKQNSDLKERRVRKFMRKIKEEDGFIHQDIIGTDYYAKYILENLAKVGILELKYYSIPRTNDVLKFKAYKLAIPVNCEDV